MSSLPRQSHTFIKICGITSIDMAQVAVEAGADAIGLVFAESSPRCIPMETALEIAARLPANVTPVALFQDASIDEINAWSHEWVQLHGHEDEDDAQRLGDKSVIKGFRFDPVQVRRWNQCQAVDVLIIDGSEGGMGESFQHDRLIDMMPEIDKPIVLAGGLAPDNVAAAIRAVRPFGVDVSSGVESSRGVKDPELIRTFCAAVQTTADR